MANSYVTFLDYTGSGKTEYTIPFNFLNPEHIKVSSANTNGLSNPYLWNYIPILTWNNNLVDGETSYPFGTYSVVFENGVNKIKYAPISANQTLNVTIYRRTPYLNTTYFSNGSPIQASDLNSILLQSAYSIEETIEAVDSVSIFKVISELNNKVSKTGDNLTGALSGVTYLALTDTGQGILAPQVQLQGGTIRNVPTPAYNTDAVNKAYVDGLTLSGGSQPVIANDSITSELLRKVVGEEAVTSTAIRTGAVTSTKLNSNSVTADKLVSNAVTSVKINSGAVTTSKIAQNAVTSTAINNGAIIEDKIGTGAVTNTKLGTGAVTNDKILDGTITAEKLVVSGLNGNSLITNNTLPYTKLQDFNGNWTTNDINLTSAKITSTATSIEAPNATLTASKFIQNKTLTYLETNSDFVNEGYINLFSGSVKFDSSNTPSQNSLKELETTTPEVFFDWYSPSNGFYSFDIRLTKPSVAGSRYGKTLFKWQRRGGQNAGNGLGSDFSSVHYSQFFYRTKANIPFNVTAINQNPIFSLDGLEITPLANSGRIIINNTNQPAKTFLITLSGFVIDSSGRLGYLYIKPLCDEYSVSSAVAPKSVYYLKFDQTARATYSFNIKSIFTVGANSMGTFACEYYYTDSNGNTPAQSVELGFGFPLGTIPGSSTALRAPEEWTNNRVNFNDSIVDLLIERI